MKIGFYSSTHLEDKRNWSGTMYRMYEQILAQGHTVTWIPKVKFSSIEEKLFFKIEKIYNKVFNRGYNKHLFTIKAIIAANHLKKQLKELDVDILFVPAEVNDFVFLKTNKPIVYLNDANVAQLLNYYPYYTGFGILSKKETLYLEKKALQNTRVSIFSSEWASQYAINNYGITSNKVKTLKFGANIIVPECLELTKSNKEYVFLFLAVDWIRKRGSLAFDSLKILRKKGFVIKMVIIGCTPEINEDWVEIIPFLNKNNLVEFNEIQNYLSTSHFLFVPTVADCTPIAFCEAAGYGLPVISTNTGGVGAHVENHYNGLILSESATEVHYANAIEELLNNPKKIEEMSRNARKKYDSELNWEKWGEDFNKILMDLT